MNIKEFPEHIKRLEYLTSKIEAAKKGIDASEKIVEILDGPIEFSYTTILYMITTAGFDVLKSNIYINAIDYLLEKQYVKECKTYAYMLNTHYPGELTKLLNEYIAEEKYERCAILKQYLNINEIPLE